VAGSYTVFSLRQTSEPPGRSAEMIPGPAVERPPAAPLSSIPPETRPVPVPTQVDLRSPSPQDLPAPAGMPPQVARSFDRGPVERPALLLTFDAGSHSSGASEILDVLAAEGVRTTFFLTGEFIHDHPDLVRRIVADGHEVGNHTETHLHLTRWEEERRHTTRPDVDRARLLAELENTQAAFMALTGESMAPLWRAPYGEYNKEILAWAAAAGWAHVGWTPSMDTLDWVADTDSHLYRDAEEIGRRLLDLPDRDDHGGRGAIVLMHLGSERPAQDQLGKILPQVLAGYRARGLRLLTASAMMQGS
jgi:peptidoglycan/xylan/chitin deacetylase (PgdA/CDA1 family)